MVASEISERPCSEVKGILGGGAWRRGGASSSAESPAEVKGRSSCEGHWGSEVTLRDTGTWRRGRGAERPCVDDGESDHLQPWSAGRSAGYDHA